MLFPLNYIKFFLGVLLNIVIGISKVFVMFGGMVKFCYIAGGKDSLVVIT